MDRIHALKMKALTVEEFEKKKDKLNLKFPPCMDKHAHK